jgi:uncharacterized protein
MEYSLSKHNIIAPITDSEEYYIVNPLSRNADILDSGTAAALLRGEFSNREELIEKGYLVKPEEEEKVFKSGYLDFLDDREGDEIQLFYVPTYSCNFNCSYCYQEGYTKKGKIDSAEVTGAFFKYVDEEFAGRKKYITVFGGEPLLPGKKTRETIQQIIQEANKRELSLAFVTNGYTLAEYIPLLNTASVREVQVTLDGPEKIHNKRRMLNGGSGTFAEIAEGVSEALGNNIPVNLRVVIDRENLPHLPELAEFSSEQGWSDNPLFKTQLGRNYELHYCQADNNKLYDRLSMYQDLYKLIKDNPGIMGFHRPAYSLSRFLFDNGEMPSPLYDSCPGCKTEWAFDYTGTIYSCTATVGKSGEDLGTFYPEKTLKDDIIDEWQERDVTSIPECRNCSFQLACGGGCASVAKNNSGTIYSPDCRPAKDLMSSGISLYFKQ